MCANEEEWRPRGDEGGEELHEHFNALPGNFVECENGH